MGRRRRRSPRCRERRGGEPVVVQHRHRRQDAGPADGARPQGGGWRPAGQDHHFCQEPEHAHFIQERFDANYPEYRGEFARTITFKTEYAQSLIDAFGQKDRAPHIAISVDMLDTGIDVPEVVNLVFFKIVRSKAKFWQMLGRGTRLCQELYGPGQDKQDFFIFPLLPEPGILQPGAGGQRGYAGATAVAAAVQCAAGADRTVGSTPGTRRCGRCSAYFICLDRSGHPRRHRYVAARHGGRHVT